MKRITKFLIVLLTVFMINSGISEVCYASTNYTLQEALYYGQAKSFFKGDLRQSNMSIKEKEKAITGAYAGGDLSMSLDFMKIFEDGPPYQKLFGNVTKGKTAVYNYNVESKKQPYIVSKTEYDITLAYFNVYKAKTEVKRKLDAYNESKTKLDKGNVLYSKGEITKETLDEQKNKVQTAKQAYEQAQIDLQNKVTKLNDLVYLKNQIKYKDYTELKSYLLKYNVPNQNTNSLFSSNDYIGFKSLTQNDNFSMDMKRARVGTDELGTLVNKAINSNKEVMQLQEQLKIDEYYIYASLDLYKKEFGNNNVSSLESLIKSGLYEIDDLDFTLKYDKFISYLIGRYGESWSPYFNIKILFIKIKIPKLFKYDQYDGVRYLEDARYDLQQRVMQFLQLVDSLEKQKKTVTEQTTNLFMDINKLDKSYEDMKKEFNDLNKEYSVNQTLYNSGKVKAEVLIKQKDELDELDEKLNSTLMDMNEKILELSYMTNGLYDKYTVSYNAQIPQTSSSPFVAPSVDDLVEKSNKLEEKSFTINYQISTVAANDTHVGTSSLELKVEGSGFDCNQYKVVTQDGVEISDLLDMKDKFVHFSTVFSNLSKLKIKFYKNGVEKYTGEFDGYGLLGKVKLK